MDITTERVTGSSPLHIALMATIIALAGCGGGGSGGPPPAADTSLDRFDALWTDFDQNYSFFELKGVDWNDARSRHRSGLSASSSDADLFAALSAMLLELEDGHVRLETPLGTSVFTGWFDQFPENFDSGIVSATYLGASEEMSPTANLIFGQAAPDIGYVRIPSLSGTGHGDDIDFVLAQLGGISGLIVDLRGNGGGNDQNGEAIAGRFTDVTRVYRSVRFRDGPNHDDFGPSIEASIAPSGQTRFTGPVAVLTNRRVFSSAESLVLAFSVIPTAFSVGDFTGGGSANPDTKTLSNGWAYTVSRWVEFRVDGTTFEGVGIEPDIRVDISVSDAANLRDTIIDAAVNELRTRLAAASSTPP